MPTVRFQGRVIRAEAGANLRAVLRAAGVPPYNGSARWLNCRGLGTCGTCAVEVRGLVSPPTARERWRLHFPPHRAGSGLRLACQCRILGDVEVVKHLGFWGQHQAC